MKFKFNTLIIVAAALLTICACGGSSDSNSSNPNGNFRMAMNPNADWVGGRHIAMQIEAKNGQITDALFRLVDEDFSIGNAQQVVGTASDGSINLTADFSIVGFEIDVDAQFTGSQWSGTYTVFNVADGGILEQGELDIVKTTSTTANVAGHWEGTATNPGGTVPVILDIVQKGNDISVSGSYDGSPILASFGSVIGDSVAISMEIPDGKTALVRFLSVVRRNGDEMDGIGMFNTGPELTMQMDRIAIR